MDQKTVLILCTGNSCRSQMAEAIVNARYPEWKAFSAGTKPAGYVHEMAIEALNEIGILHLGESKHIDDLPTKGFDLVVTVCDSAAEECPVWPGKAGSRVHHGFVDPAKAEGTLEARKQVFRQVRSEMLEVIPELLEGSVP
jgi:arsenate reductase